MSGPEHTERSIGLAGAVFTLVGFLIGASIFILPGQLAASAGPGVVLAYLFAGVMAFFACLLAAQVGSVISRSGGSYHAISRLISPMAGFVSLWLLVIAICVATALVALGFANYWAVYFPSSNTTAVAIGLVSVFCVINVIGTRTSVLSQTVMTTLFLAAMAMFGITGIANMEVGHLRPFLPQGFGSVLTVMIPAYFSWIGFTVLIEIGGEIKNPGRNIFRSLMIGFVIVLAFYTAVPLALVGTLPWETLAGNPAPISTAADLLFPNWLANAITLSALLASATSVNGIILAYSRDVFAMAKQRMLPEQLGKLTRRHAVPANAVVAFSVVVVLFLLLGGSITDYASITVMGIMVIQIALAICVIRIPDQMRADYEKGAFRLSRPMIRISSGVVILSSLGFLAKAAFDDPEKGLTVLGIVAVGWAWYRLRTRQLGQ